MKVTLWGTRGSLPSHGPENARYGGNTSCVEVWGDDGTLVVLDAGTGIRRLGASLANHTARIDILLTHLHMDHLQGLGFFRPLYVPGLPVHVWGPAHTTEGLRERLVRYLSPPLYPVRLRDLPCDITLHAVPRGSVQVGGLTVTADYICHPGPTVGFRLEENGVALAFLPDHEPALGLTDFPDEADWTSGYALARGASLLIHDAQYTADEYVDHVGWGHSAIDHAVALARLAGAKRLVTFHHDPGHDDDTLDAMVRVAREQVGTAFEVEGGMEASTFSLTS